MEFSIAMLFGEYSGFVLGALGVAFAVFLSGTGSARGVGIGGEAAAAISKEKPEHFGKALLLQALPATQGIYGFVVGFLILTNLEMTMSAAMGWYYLAAGLIVGITGLTSAPAQGRVSVAGMQIIAQKPEANNQGLVYSAMVETYAILGFVISLLMIFVN